MFVAIRKEPNGSLYLDPYFFDRFTDLDLGTYRYTKVEVPDEYKYDLEVEDFDPETLEFDKQRYSHRLNREKLREERADILSWFEYYDNQVKQYERCVRMGAVFDKDITELDDKAKKNQERMREIKLILGE